MDREQLVVDLTQMIKEILTQAQLHAGDTFVLGCSTSEIAGGYIGKNPSQEIGEWVVRTIKDLLDAEGIHLAVQGCEHLNRALVVERAVARDAQWEIVEVLPSLTAGGACSVAALSTSMIQLKLNTSLLKQALISGIRRLGCTSSMYKFPFARQKKNSAAHTSRH